MIGRPPGLSGVPSKIFSANSTDGSCHQPQHDITHEQH